MLALGCLFPVLLAIGGAMIGAMLGGNTGTLWGGIGGLALGCAVPAIMLFALGSARNKR
ncbi:hypothetical protein FHS61_001150 [Altererythrobacter atlanticus]|uniref:Uncharacterized protein n=1 Tax=Croceibacterium atlanticum TaxID=1267766 RepID=A0A0F7KWI9_9SPHN|nr:hypothetical protein [Croceibacterium atlanticum]AKH43150.1 hypothetical protein WYH_02116 [Croceibacterium atlanticum]MBB5732146.1 hypothetical protein [Croceibacterium atlanticum]